MIKVLRVLRNLLVSKKQKKEAPVDPLWLVSHAERVGAFQSDKKSAENNPR